MLFGIEFNYCVIQLVHICSKCAPSELLPLIVKLLYNLFKLLNVLVYGHVMGNLERARFRVSTFWLTSMTGRKRTLKVARADDDERHDNSLLARSVELTVDRKRLRTSLPEACARLNASGGASARIDWSSQFSPAVADDSFASQAPLLKKAPRRYANSVRCFIIYQAHEPDLGI